MAKESQAGGLSLNGTSYAPGQVTMDSIETKPMYGGNLLRWLFRRPKFWEVTISYRT